MKRRLLVILLVSLSLLQFGCSTGTPNNPAKVSDGGTGSTNVLNPGSSEVNGSESTVVPVQQIKLVKKPNKTKYLLTNGVEILGDTENINTSKGDVTIYMPQVSGLKDKLLQERLNKDIKDSISKEVQNYADERDEKPTNLYPLVDLNANNLLSIDLREMYTPIYGFLYRLTDGKKLYLKDIFTEGTDYVPLINQKVIEGILKKDGEEEGNLSKPFSTIASDQNFALTEDTLYMIFHKGEGGFVERNSVSIPLTQIDDYVDVTDRYSGSERKNHERLDLIVRKNNIFITWKADILKKNNGNLWLQYPEVSGLRDDAFQEALNKDIKDGIYEIAKEKVIDDLRKSSNQENNYNYIATTQMFVTFNHYGILCIQREAFGGEGSKNLQQFNKTYTFDLNNKKRINEKDLLTKYIKEDKNLQEGFASDVRYYLINKPYVTRSKEFITNVNSKVDYNFIMNNSEIHFFNGDNKGDIAILVVFKGNTFDSTSEIISCNVPLKTIVKDSPEDFFGW